MKRPLICGLAILTALFAALLLGQSVCQAETVGGKSEKALRQAVEDDPKDVDSLLALARLERGRKCYSEAAELYRRALEAAPEGRKEGIEVELATVLGWSGDFKGAIEAFTDVLSKDPANKEARAGLARSYSWAGDYGKAIDEYGAILKTNPGDVEARIGLARVYSWQGELERAIDAYSAVIAEHPESEEARMGLARVLWWKGEFEKSQAELREVISRNPENRDAKKMLRRLREDKGPALSLHWSGSSDSDSNDLKIYGARGFYNFGPLCRLTLEYSRFDASRFSQKAHADVLTLKDSTRLSRGLVLTPHLSFTKTDTDVGGTKYITGGAALDWTINRDWRTIASFNVYPYLDTVQLIENSVKVREVSAAVLHDWRDFTVSLWASYSDYSDGNTGKGLRGNIAWRVLKDPSVITGFVSEYREYSEKTNSGYFNPHDILSNNLYLTVSGEFYRDIFEYLATATVGVQSFSSRSEYTSSFLAKLTGHVTESLSAYAGYKWSRSALESAAGFRFEEYKAGIEYLF